MDFEAPDTGIPDDFPSAFRTSRCPASPGPRVGLRSAKFDTRPAPKAGPKSAPETETKQTPKTEQTPKTKATQASQPLTLSVGPHRHYHAENSRHQLAKPNLSSERKNLKEHKIIKIEADESVTPPPLPAPAVPASPQPDSSKESVKPALSKSARKRTRYEKLQIQQQALSQLRASGFHHDSIPIAVPNPLYQDQLADMHLLPLYCAKTPFQTLHLVYQVLTGSTIQRDALVSRLKRIIASLGWKASTGVVEFDEALQKTRAKFQAKMARPGVDAEMKKQLQGKMLRVLKRKVRLNIEKLAAAQDSSVSRKDEDMED